MDDFQRQAEGNVEQSMKLAFPDARDRLYDLEACTIATDQARRHAASENFGAEHPLTIAYRAVADVHAEKAAVLTRSRVIASLEL